MSGWVVMIEGQNIRRVGRWWPSLKAIRGAIDEDASLFILYRDAQKAVRISKAADKAHGARFTYKIIRVWPVEAVHA